MPVAWGWVNCILELGRCRYRRWFWCVALVRGIRKRLIPIYRQASLAVADYIKEGSSPVNTWQWGESLFLIGGARDSPDRVSADTKGLCKSAELDKGITPHTHETQFCYSYAQRGLTCGQSRIAGSRNISTTQYYTSHQWACPAYLWKSHPRAKQQQA